MPDPKPVTLTIEWPQRTDPATVAFVAAQTAKHVQNALEAGVSTARNARAAGWQEGRAGGWREGYEAGRQAGHEAGRREGESHAWKLTGTVAELAAAQDARDRERGANG